MQSSDITHIAGRVIIVEDANDLLRQVQDALHHLHSAAGEAADITAAALDEEYWERLQDIIAKRRQSGQIPPDGQADTASVLRELLHALQLHLMNLPILTVTMAVPPRHDFVRILAEQIDAGGIAPCKLAITVDCTIVAGAVIAWQGRVLDLSLRQKLEAQVAKEYARKVAPPGNAAAPKK